VRDGSKHGLGLWHRSIATATRQRAFTFAAPWSIGRVGPDAIALVGATHSADILNRVPDAMPNPRDELLPYANASRGFRPPQMTGLYRLQRDQAA
jgi:outer membrane receptor protein involved in Fe transport